MQPSPSRGGIVITTKKGLYNGNVATMVTDITGLATVDKPEQSQSAYAYKYDQLQRIKFGKNAALDQGNYIFRGSYSTEYSYDKDGNLKTLQRAGSNDTPMDDLTYNYLNGNTNTSNRLLGINDQVSAGNFPNDLEGTQYTYDAIGNLKSDSHEGLTNVEWDAFHKIKKISKATYGDLNYQYDPNGQRAVKSNSNNGHTDYYVRDPQGNILSVYTYKGPESQEPVQSEINLYGSNRLGVYTMSRPGFTNMDLNPDNVTGARTRAYKHYELSNHLGNVLNTISDRKIGNNPNGGLVQYYTAEVLSASDYDPFGMQLDGRSVSSSTYSYGFGGQQKDDEIYGSGNSYTAAFWEYDPRLGRRWNIDPILDPSQSSYACFNNNPIAFNDINGDCPDCPDHDVESKYLGGMGVNMGSFGNGVADGFIGALPEVASFAWDMLTDEGARDEFMAGMQTLMADPLGAIKAIAGEKYDLYSSVLSGEGTEQQQYEVGKEIGNLLFGVATGAAAAKLTEVIKVAKYEKKLVEVAEAADKATGAGKATTRGTAIHKKFEKALPKGKAEVSYKGKDVVTRGKKGSVRADAIYGSQKKPKVAYDLKTGKSGMSKSDAAKYKQNLPKGTKVKEISKGSNGKYQVKKR